MDTHGILLDARLADRYTIERQIGRGGMATVYLATDLRHNRSIAIKVLSPELAASIGAGRFLREIAIAARLTHPHILPLFDSGEVVTSRGSQVTSLETRDPRPATLLYYTMPYIAGDSLRDRLRREGQLPVGEAVRIAHRLTEALAYAHAHDVVHRDIKPENILLGDGEPVLADFGIARALDVASDDLSTAGLTIGTPTYMSPEQLAGADVDGRSDIYSLGCVLYEMLVGEAPFTGPSLQVVRARHQLEPPRSVTLVRPSVPRHLEQVLERALAKLPADRYQSAAELATELELATSESLSGSRPVPDAPARKAAPRHWWAWMLGAAAALGLTAMLFWPRAVLDSDRVVVFPLSESGATAADKPGQSVALLLGHAVQHTAPLRWIDGWTLLSMEQQQAVTGLPAAIERRLARRAGARFFVDGAIVNGRDSVTVLLRLYDADGDSLVQQVSQAAPAALASLTWPALGVLAQLLPSLLAPGRDFDGQVLTSLAGHEPGPLANWLQGDRAYREGRFEPALEHYQRAVAQDSTLALAALSGAQAAGWLALQEEAVRLARLALRHAGSLPSRFRDLAAAFESFGSGRADSAVAQVDRALAADSLWAEAWAVKGEIYLHLLPLDGNLDSVAEAAFARAAALDPDFTPPLNHLAELMLRRGDIRDAGAITERLQHGAADSLLFGPLLLMRSCLRGDTSGAEWARAVESDPSPVLTAARQLAAGGAHLACAKHGFRAVLDNPSADPASKWGALLGLNAILMVAGEPGALRHLLDSAVATMPSARELYLFDAIAGRSLDGLGDSLAMTLWSAPPPPSAPRLWYLGQWSAARGDTARLLGIAEAAASLRNRSAAASDSLLASVLDARLGLLRGDTSGAMTRLSVLASVVPLDSLVWDRWDALPAERVLLAELLQARGKPEEAIAAASVLDGSQALAFLPFLSRSLAVRVRAADQLGRRREAATLRERLAALTPNDARLDSNVPGP